MLSVKSQLVRFLALRYWAFLKLSYCASWVEVLGVPGVELFCCSVYWAS